MPLAEAQGAWLAEMFTGRWAPPTADVVRAETLRDDTAYRKRFYTSERHTMEVDFDRYLWSLDRERRRGALRAQQRLSSPAGTGARAEGGPRARWRGSRPFRSS